VTGQEFSMSHWPFITAAYGVFVALMLTDFFTARAGRSRLLRELAARQRRAKQRAAP